MSIKFDKTFFLGLLSLDESNKALFLSPIISSLICIGLLSIFALFPFEKPIPNDVLNMCIMMFGALIAAFSMSHRYFFLTKHLLKFNPFKDDPDEDKKLQFLIVMPVYFGFFTFFFFIMFANSALGFGILKSSVNPIFSTVVIVVAYLFALAVFKFEILQTIKKIKDKSVNQVDELELTH